MPNHFAATGKAPQRVLLSCMVLMLRVFCCEWSSVAHAKALCSLVTVQKMIFRCYIRFGQLYGYFSFRLMRSLGSRWKSTVKVLRIFCVGCSQQQQLHNVYICLVSTCLSCEAVVAGRQRKKRVENGGSS